MSLQGRRSSIINIDEWLDKCSSNEPDSIIYDPDHSREVVESVKRQLDPIIESNFKSILDCCSEMGLASNVIDENLSESVVFITDCLTSLSKTYLEGKEKLCRYEEELVTKVSKMTADLCLPPYERDGSLTLSQHCKYLKGKFNELNSVRESRMSKFQELRDKQLKQCAMLGIKTPQVKLQTDIPTEEELTKLAGAVVELAREEERRKNKYALLKEMISKCMEQLEAEPKNEFELNIMRSTQLDLSEDNLVRMSNLHSELEARFAEQQEKYEQLKQRLISLYDRLDVDQSTRDEFLETHNVCKPTLMAEMSVEIELYEELKKQNIGKFIDKIKDELVLEYERCYMTQEEQDNFFSLSTSSDECNEELLELYERELERIKKYYEANKEMLEKFSKWRMMWKELIELEVKANDPGRFNNRGGQLLLEEKKRKTLQKGLPKVEKELVEMNERFSASNQGAKFKVFNLNLDDFIAGCWDELNTAKEEEKRERQRAKMTDGANKNRKAPQAHVLVGRTPTKRAAGPGVTPTPTKLQRSVLGTPSHQNTLRTNVTATSGSVKKGPQRNLFQPNKIPRPNDVRKNPNDNSHIPVFNHKQTSQPRGKNVTSVGSESSALSLSEQEFENEIICCPASAKRGFK